MYDGLPLINNHATHSFEIMVGGKRAFIDYGKNGDTYLLLHTEVPEIMRGKGIAGALVEKAFKYLETNGFKMRAYCPYVQAYLKKHPKWERLLETQ